MLLLLDQLSGFLIKLALD